MASKTVKEVIFIARCEFKCDSRKVVYLARSSNGVDQYETSLFDGKATGCSCPSRKPCKHMKAAEAKEAARKEVATQFKAKSAPAWFVNLVSTGKVETPKQVVVLRTQADESQAVGSFKKRELPTKVTDISTKGALNGNRGFSLLKVS